MSMHKVPLSPLEEEGLKKHHLKIGTPSQLSDTFRLGMKWHENAFLDDLEELLAISKAGAMIGGGDAVTSCLKINAKVARLIHSIRKDEGPDFHDGHDHEGFEGGCARMGCDGSCENDGKE